MLPAVLLICITCFYLKSGEHQFRSNYSDINSFSRHESFPKEIEKSSTFYSSKQELYRTKNGIYTQSTTTAHSSFAKAPNMANVALTLRETIIGSTNKYAVIEDHRTNLQSLYRIGDIVQGAEIHQIMKDHVALKYKGQNFILLNDLKQILHKENPHEQPTLNTSKFIVDRSVICSLSKDIENVKRQIGFRPLVSKSKNEGLLLYRINPGSVFSRIGLKNGDVLKKINGSSIFSLNDFPPIYKDILTKEQMSVTIQRKGKNHELLCQLSSVEGIN